MKEGDVLLVSEWKISNRNLLRKPQWCVVVRVQEDSAHVEWLACKPPPVSGVFCNDIVCTDSSEHGADVFTTVPEDEWPDEVCAAFVKWRLLNGDSNEPA